MKGRTRESNRKDVQSTPEVLDVVATQASFQVSVSFRVKKDEKYKMVVFLGKGVREGRCRKKNNRSYLHLESDSVREVSVTPVVLTDLEK